MRLQNFLSNNYLAFLGIITLGVFLPLSVLAESPELTQQYPNPNNRINVYPQNSNSTPTVPVGEGSQVAIEPVNGYVSVKLINTTNTPVRYQVIGDTNLRILSNSSSANLQELQTPVNISFYREDGGRLFATAKKSATPGVLEVSLTEAMNTESYHGSLTVEPTGRINFQ
jgi:hypothetical protein